MSGITFELPGFDQQHEREQERERQQRDRHAEEVDELLAAALLSSDVTATAAARGARRAQQRKGWGFGVGAAAGDEEDEDDEEAADRSASGGVLQELLLPWHCQSCTLRNDAARGACEACGLVNKRRARLRARGQEERRALLARKAEEKRSEAERMEDLEELGDDGDDDDDDEVIVVEAGDDGDGNDSDVVVVIEKAPAPPRRQQQPSPSPQPAPARASSTSSSTSSSAAAPTPLARLTPMLLHGGLSPFGVLPADLALHALHFLQDPVAYSGLRTLSKGWSRVAEHESLWRPLAEARFKPPPPSPPPARTPTPQAPAASASGSASVSASSDGRARRESAASSSSLGLPASWSCKACGLLQADRFGLHCEFCQAEREIVGASPAAAAAASASAASATAAASAGDGEEEEEEEEPACCFRVIKNYDELALAWRSSGGRGGKTLGEGGGGGEEGGAEAPPKADRPLYSEEKKRQADAAALEASSRLMTGAGSTPEGHERVHLAGAGVQSVWAVALATGDFYFLYKLLALDRALSARWDSLHAGYEWLANSARAALRTRLYATREQIYQRDDSLISIPESFQKVVNKLTARAWPRLWECMRVELGLQAEALRRDALRHLRQAIGGGNGSGGGGGGSGVVKGYRLLLEEVLRAFRVFAQWAFEVCAFFGKLNDQISGERFRATTSTLVGCGVKEAAATPYVSELALLGFRDRFLMHFAVRTPLLGAVEGDAALSVAALWGSAGPDLTGGGGAGGGRGAAAAVAAAEETGVEPEESEVDRRVLRQRAETDAAAAAAAAGGDGHGGGAEGAAERQRAAEEGARRRVIENVSDLLQALGKVCEELDVPEGAPVDEGEGGVPLGPAYRRFILRPLRDTLAEMRVDGVVGGLGGGEGEGEGEEGVAGVGGVSLKEESLCGGGGGGGGGGGRAWGRGSFRRQRGGLEDGVERLAKRMRLV